MNQIETEQSKYEMTPDEVRIVEWLEQHAEIDRSAAPPHEPSLAHLQVLAGGVLKELVAAQIRLGMHRD